MGIEEYTGVYKGSTRYYYTLRVLTICRKEPVGMNTD